MTQHPEKVTTAAALKERIAVWRKDGEPVAFVPTMGALHDGHLSLVKLAKQKADRVVVSIFVNPRQFAPGEDLDAYPRDLAGDLQKLADPGCDLVYVPGVGEIYPPGFCTRINVGGVSKGLCSTTRPHFFEGVATVVTRLLMQVTPDVAVFGEKDYQQLLVIKRLVSDLALPVEILGAPLVREKDGLALSSRNAYLSPEERQTAPLLYRVLQDIAAQLKDGAPFAALRERAWTRLEKAGFEPDYLELRDAQTLEPFNSYDGTPARLLVAARLGHTRLIDNIAVMG